jgi:hypothetical protein
MTLLALICIGYSLIVSCYLLLSSRGARRRYQRAVDARSEGPQVYESWALLPDTEPTPAFTAEPTPHQPQSAEQWSGGYRTAAV